MDRQNSKDKFISFLVWNVQGVVKSEYLLTLKELIRTYEPKVLALVETKVSGVIAENVHRKIGFRGMHRVEALVLVGESG